MTIAVFRYQATEPVLQALAAAGLLDGKEWYQNRGDAQTLTECLAGVRPEEIVGDLSTPTLRTADGYLVTTVLADAEVIDTALAASPELLCDWRSDQFDADGAPLPWPEYDMSATTDEGVITWRQGAGMIA